MAAVSVRVGMPVHSADGHQIGVVERVTGDSFFAAGQRLTLDAIERVETGGLYLWGDRSVYDTDEGAASAGPARDTRLPNTDAPLFVNERPVRRSLEERMPRDDQR